MKIIGTGSYLPDRIVSNEELEGVDSLWVKEKLGIRSRRVSIKGTSYLGAKAAEIAIKDAGLFPTDIGMIIVATATPEKLNPSTAAIIQDKIGAHTAIAFDISAVCSGFVYALDMAKRYLYDYENILVIGADTFSHITDWDHRDCVFFGDGAGAAVITGSNNEYYGRLYADGRGQHDFETDHGGTFKMDSKAVYNAGVKYLPKAIKDVLYVANLNVNAISWFLPHQASVTMLKDIVLIVGVPWDKVKTNMDGYGNTAGASIPILIDESKKDFNKGDYILLASIGSGWAYGAIIIEW